jgi:hypothetical protein
MSVLLLWGTFFVYVPLSALAECEITSGQYDDVLRFCVCDVEFSALSLG